MPENKNSPAPRDTTATREPAAPTAPTGAAVRMMTKGIAGKGPAASKEKARRTADAVRPSQKPIAGSGRKGPRRGASKGR